jgi:hypothetical protein
MRKKLFFILLIIFFVGGKDFAQSNIAQQNIDENRAVSMDTVRLVITDGLHKEEVKKQIENNAAQLFTAMGLAVVEGKWPDLSHVRMTPEAAKTMLSMWNTSAMARPSSDVERKCLIRPQGGYQIRDVPITMLEAPEKDRKQNLVINFTNEGIIDDIFIAVHGIVDFYDNNANVNDFVRKQRILDLVERFRTAYNMRDIDFLVKIFSNNALIITGKVIKEKPNSDYVLKNNLTTERIEYVTQTKEQYIKKLKLIFNMIKYINVVFEDIEVSTHTKFPEIYGVNLKQKWNASNYSDEGFLFLMIDFKNENEPVIQVRAWQPLVFNGRELKPEEKFRTTSFGDLRGR